jgi:uncharacterized protein
MKSDESLLERLRQVLSSSAPTVVACSGGIDSMLLATISHRQDPVNTLVVHSTSPAVPEQAGSRVRHAAAKEGWRLSMIRTGEFNNQAYLSNPSDRCYHCKSHLYLRVDSFIQHTPGFETGTIVSGTNKDDLLDYRPGLQAAREYGVRHPYIEAGLGKQDIRQLARYLDLSFSELPASPCLSSRIYTDTPITELRLRAIDKGEIFLKQATGVEIVRCRIKDDTMRIEVNEKDQKLIGANLLRDLARQVEQIEPTIKQVVIDPRAYAPGRAVIRVR